MKCLKAWEIQKRKNECLADSRPARSDKKALQIAKPGDIVVVTGKGAEETMAIGTKRIPWNDPQIIRELLREPETKQSR